MFSLKTLYRRHIHIARSVLSSTSSFKVLAADLDFNQEDLQYAKVLSRKANDVLEALLSKVKTGGGAKAIHRHTAIRKKILVRERIKLLFDESSPFMEIGALAGLSMDYGDVPAAGLVAGIGKINNCYCMVAANDATVKGGTFFPITVAKQIRLQHIALSNKLPCIYIVDSGGAFLPLQAEIFPDKEHGGRTFYSEAVFSSYGMPQIAIVCGSSTAGGAYCPTMAEETIIVEGSGLIFLGGPPLVKAATGEVVSEQELGGAEMHCSVSGCTDHYAESEQEAFEICRDSVLALNLPQNVSQEKYDEPVYPSEELNVIAGKAVLQKEDMYKIFARILDGSRFSEFKEKYGTNLVTGFAHVCGKLIGLLANCGDVTWKDAQKGAHFIQLCEKRQVPLVFVQNSGNTTKNNDLEFQGYVLKERAKMITAHSSAKLPKISINVGGCFADENFTMCGLSFEPNFLLSWPLAHTSFEESKKRHFTDAESSDKDALISGILDDISSAFHRSSRMLVDDVILPSSTRKVLSLCLDIATSRTSHATVLQNTEHAVMRM